MRFALFITLSVLLSLSACYPGPSNRKVDLNGVKTTIQTCGTGDVALIFVHGWGINHSYWEHQHEYFCPEYRVISVDLPGFGDSGKNRDEWTIEQYGKDIVEVIDQQELRNIVLIGHSMAGDVILEAARQRILVTALIGVDNFKDVGMPIDSATQAEIDGFLGMLKANYKEVAASYSEGFLFHESTSQEVKDRVIQDIVETDSTVAISSMESLLAYAAKEPSQLSKIEQKLYLINSDATPTYLEGLDATGVDYEVVPIHATGHYPMIEKLEEFNALLKQVLDDLFKR